MNASTLWAAALALTLCSAHAVSAQATARERAREVLPQQVFMAIDGMADEAAREGVPAEALFSKALEGVAKRVPAERLVPAVRMYAERLGTARASLGAAAPAGVVVAGADALARGVRPEVLRRMAEARPHSPVALLVLADLVEAGVPEDRALTLLREAMRQRMADPQMLEMTARMRGLLRQGHSPQEAVERIRRAMMGRRGPGASLGPPVPPGSEPLTRERAHSGRHRGGRGG